MKIAKGSVVALDYRLHLGDGVTVDASEGGEPLQYIHGEGQIVPGLETALEGLEAGSTRQVVVEPANGYCDYDSKGLQEVSHDAFGGRLPDVGGQYLARGPDGESVPFSKKTDDSFEVSSSHLDASGDSVSWPDASRNRGIAPDLPPSSAGVTNTPSEMTIDISPPATTPGMLSGSVMRRKMRTGPAPMICAARRSSGFCASRLASTGSTTNGIRKWAMPTITPTLASLLGRAPGVQVTENPDGSISVRIRAAASFYACSEPLYVVDGSPVTPEPGGTLRGINPHDVQSIQVLRYPPETSLYGVRGANGVILITTIRARR